MSTSTRRGQATDKHCLDEICNKKKISGAHWSRHKNDKQHGVDVGYELCVGKGGCETCIK
jgi:hypothetical protein